MDYGSSTMATVNDDSERVRGLLRTVQYPGFRRDIVAVGFIKDIEVNGSQVTVHFAPNTTNQTKVAQMEADIHKALAGAGDFTQIDIQRHDPFAGTGVLRNGGMTPLQAEMLEDGVVPQPDAIGREMQRPDLAFEAGYDEDGPESLGGPRSDVYEGELPVCQWETLEGIPGTSPWLTTVIVSNGAVDLYGTVEDAAARDPSRIAIEKKPFVVKVTDHRSVLQPY
jgi:metal-sulfur cluster biosynthetic enzyme